jgi:hypothetical protein
MRLRRAAMLSVMVLGVLATADAAFAQSSGDAPERNFCGDCLGAPYRVDITGALKPGTNKLEIKVMDESADRRSPPVA